ncbi:MAG: protein kinase [Akkermansia sp.]|nr:protein kinase [Akkermansia sp.]
MTEAEKEELVAVLSEEYLAMARAGELVSVTEYAAAHPECESDLLEILPLMLDVEGLGRTSLPPAPMMAHYPEHLGDYHLLERIGSGGMGTVFRARQESLHREVAVKILAPSWSTDLHISEAFEKESRVLAGLRHTNIVEVFGAGREGQYRYYVMGLVKGKGLSAGRLGAAFPGVPYAEAVARVGVQAAGALAFAHAHGVIHRDIKPGNLLLGNDGVLLVSDFGLATILNAGEEAPLVAQSQDGTVRYMAPERLSGKSDTFAGDQYSLGLTLYELLSREQAFGNVEGGSLVQTICAGELSPLKGFGELGAVVNKAVAFDPTQRYESMQAMADDLQRVLDSVPVKARRASLWRRYRLWTKRRPAAAVWSHVAAFLLVALYATITMAYARVKNSLRSENEQRERAELNEQIADASLQRILASMVSQSSSEHEDFLPPSRADVRLLQDLMPYYEQLAEQENSGDKVVQASSILAAISQQTGDYVMAEKYYARVAKLTTSGSYEHIKALIGQAKAIYSQENRARYREAGKLLTTLPRYVAPDADFETRLEVVRALQLAARYMRRPAARQVANEMNERRRDVAEAVLGTSADLQQQAAERLSALLQEQPQHTGARLLQSELLAVARSPKVRELLSSKGETALSLLEGLLREYPDMADYKRAYVRLAVMPSRFSLQRPSLQQAAAYAQELMAESAADSELIMLYLAAREMLNRELVQAGRDEEARKERERTLGVLSFVTLRHDFTPAIREKLVHWATRHYMRENHTPQHEEELKTLLKDYDAERIKALNNRLLRMRRMRPGRGGRHFFPGRAGNRR